MPQIEKASDAAQPSFEELTRQAEAEAGIGEFYDAEGNTGEAAPVEAEQPPIVEEPAVETPTVETPAEDTPEIEAVVEAAAPDELADVKQKLGQLINENADLRRQQDAWSQAFEQASQQPQYTGDQFNEVLMENPAQATLLAYQANDQGAFHRAWQAWEEVSPGAPMNWYDNQMLRGELAGLQNRVASQIAPAQALAQQSEQEQAIAAVAGRHDDFEQVLGTLDEKKAAEILQSGFPTQILEGMVTGDQESKEKVVEFLYRWQKAEQTGHLVQAAQESAGKTAEEARSAKLAATVASASTTTPDPVEESEAERQMRVWQTSQPSVRSGWTGQESRYNRR